MTAAAGPLTPRTPAERRARGLSIDELARESRAKQGLPETIEDEATLLRVAGMVVAGLQRRREVGPVR